MICASSALRQCRSDTARPRSFPLLPDFGHQRFPRWPRTGGACCTKVSSIERGANGIRRGQAIGRSQRSDGDTDPDTLVRLLHAREFAQPSTNQYRSHPADNSARTLIASASRADHQAHYKIEYYRHRLWQANCHRLGRYSVIRSVSVAVASPGALETAMGNRHNGRLPDGD
jgi:hypothetical protein